MKTANFNGNLYNKYRIKRWHIVLDKLSVLADDSKEWKILSMMIYETAEV